MEKNVGGQDRTMRIVGGFIALALGYFVSPWFYILALIGFATAAINWCPLNKLFGINTCKMHVEEETKVELEEKKEETPSSTEM